MVVALAIVAAIGDTGRFERPEKLVSYFGLNPSVRQSGPGPAYHGRITKQGRGHARGMLVEAAWAAARAPGPLRAFFLRVRARRGQHVAAVATACKLAVVIWHLLRKGESYAWARSALHVIDEPRDRRRSAGRRLRGAAKLPRLAASPPRFDLSALLKHPCRQPFADQPDNPPITNPMLNEPCQPCVADRVEGSSC